MWIAIVLIVLTYPDGKCSEYSFIILLSVRHIISISPQYTLVVEKKIGKFWNSRETYFFRLEMSFVRFSKTQYPSPGYFGKGVVYLEIQKYFEENFVCSLFLRVLLDFERFYY